MVSKEEGDIEPGSPLISFYPSFFLLLGSPCSPVSTRSIDLKVEASFTKKCSRSRTLVNTVLTAVGLGVIKLPYIFVHGGWVGGGLALLAAGGCSLYTTKLLASVLVRNRGGKVVSSFEELGEVIFGSWGKLICGGSLYATLLLVLVILVILSAEGLADLFDGEVKKWVWISGGLLLPLTWLPSLKEVAWVSMAGIIAIFTLIFIVVIFCIDEVFSGRDYEGGVVVEYKVFPTDFLSFITAFCTCFFSFCITTTVPNLVSSMQNPMDFPQIAEKGFAIIMLIFSTISVASYLAFGSALADYDHVLRPIVEAKASYVKPIQISTFVLVISQYLVLFSPWAAFIDATLLAQCSLFDGREVTALGLQTDHGSSQWTGKMIFLRSAARSVFTLLVVVFAAFLPYPGSLLDLLSGVTVVFLSVPLPIVCKWKCDQQMSTEVNEKGTWFFQLALLGLSAVFMIFGTYNGMKIFIEVMKSGTESFDETGE